ncbi:MAG: TetM/TetW/TetO/TetS family tetracycline resistance ribosomal protection protein [Eubacterium sp.]|nr:TetM/TetW/TetO/TetS family tetracycline resistance ribosomal protection protein [Candidatus Colimonas fimequi]
MKRITTGILAHVDAGKTTLSEAMLYKTGAIRKLGRVDHKDAFLDTDAQERERGITIFSKQAEMQVGDTSVLLLDTPGHVDFSSEMERTLQVLDYAILVISGKDGVQGHTVTLWKLLRRYNVPAFIFVNKMDLETADKNAVFENIRQKLSPNCIEFAGDFLEDEETAGCSEELIEEYFEEGAVSVASVAKAIARREMFPCFFGSALKVQGVDELLEAFQEYTIEKEYPEGFAARVFKITRDGRGARLTHMKITGGVLKAKELIGEEKVDQLRIYSGEKFRTVDAASAGQILAVTGLEETWAGQNLGAEKNAQSASLEPALIYDVIHSPEDDVHTVLSKLRELEEEDPQLHITWNDQIRTIQIQLMGEVQLEILRNLIKDRFGMSLEFGEGRIAYKETIANTVIGAGHFEPLRHYAEVQLLMEPGPRGSGVTIDTICSEDVLDKNWQRLIATHLVEREHPGVLMGAALTDIKLTIAAGRAHLKHTEGGDFRQATYRAIRQGLMKAECLLLEPWYTFTLEVPQDMVGSAMADIQRMSGTFEMPVTENGMSVLTGRAPVSEMKDYQSKVNSYTKGHGHLICNVEGYDVCHNQDEVLAGSIYDPMRDIANPADSVFCSHGAGYNVRWDEVDDMVHTSVYIPGVTAIREEADSTPAAYTSVSNRTYTDEDFSGPAFVHAPDRTVRKERRAPRVIEGERVVRKTKSMEVLPEFILVDGYNIIFAWDELKALAKVNIDAARDALIEIMQNFQGYKNCDVVVVFDAYKIKGGERRVVKHDNVTVVYTQEAETADAYIEKTTYEIGHKYRVRVATSDRLGQMIIIGNGAFKISAPDFKKEVEAANQDIAKMLEEHNRRNGREHKNTIKIKK